MKTISLSEYTSLTYGAEVLSKLTIDGQIHHRVLRLSDGSIFKLFRIKRIITSAHLFPYVSRFCNNATRLTNLGIPTIQILATYRIPAINRTAVHYQPLDGITLREHAKTTPLENEVSRRIGVFFNLLHEKGIYFRSIHFDNIVITPDGQFGLIDIVDMRFRKRPLSTQLRIRNLRHLFRYGSDTEMLAPVQNAFIEAYFQNSRLSRRNKARFCRHFNNHLASSKK
jgi:hypothetical protein